MRTKATMTRARAKKLIQEGNGIVGAARRSGLSYGTMHRIAREYGMVGSPGRKALQITKSSLRKYRKGYTWRRIADDLGCSESAARNAFKRLGVDKQDLRTPKGGHDCAL